MIIGESLNGLNFYQVKYSSDKIAIDCNFIFSAQCLQIKKA